MCILATSNNVVFPISVVFLTLLAYMGFYRGSSLFLIVGLVVWGLPMDWSAYNDSLVRRDEVLLDFSALKGWGREVKRMSAGRRGRSFTYPDSLIRLLLHLLTGNLRGSLGGYPGMLIG